MEREELINERNRLFKSLKGQYVERAERNEKLKIVYLIICVSLLALIVIDFIQGSFWDKDEIISKIMMAIVLVVGVFSYISTNRIVKAGNAQDFLAIYDRNNRIWYLITVVLTALIVGLKIMDKGFDKGAAVASILFVAAVTGCFLWDKFFSRKGKEIRRLRELVQMPHDNP